MMKSGMSVRVVDIWLEVYELIFNSVITHVDCYGKMLGIFNNSESREVYNDDSVQMPILFRF